MAIIFQKTNPYTTPQTYQLKREDFFALTEPYVLSGNIVDVERQKIYSGRVHILDGKILRIEPCAVPETHYIMPGFIDAHVHIESSMLTPSAFAAEAVKHGVVAALADPHEIANVMGVEGIDYMIRDSRNSGFKFFFGAPSCVPATPLEHAGAVLEATTIEELLRRDDIHFLAEMMNYPGVLNDDPEVLAKLAAAKKYNKPVDGHAPGLGGPALEKYIRAGITTDHECMDTCEAEEKIDRGMDVIIREGSAAKNFDLLYPLINRYPSAVMLCTDDCHPHELVSGYLLHIFQRGLDKDLNFFNLLKAISTNAIDHYKLPVGRLREGDPADCIIVDNLDYPIVKQTYIDGRLVYDAPNSFISIIKSSPINNFKALPLVKEQIALKVKSESIRVIELIDKSLYTKKQILAAPVQDGLVVADPEQDVLKVVVLNRYTENAVPAIGFIKGFGLKYGALCSSVAHDSHNLIAVGADDANLLAAINAVIAAQGGLAVCTGIDEAANLAPGTDTEKGINGIPLRQQHSVQLLPLPVAGLMASATALETAKAYEALQQSVRAMGCPLAAPFMSLAFMSLIVIPELKIFDGGLFDTGNFKPVDLFV